MNRRLFFQKPFFIENRQVQVADHGANGVIPGQTQQYFTIGQLNERVIAQLIFTGFIGDRFGIAPGAPGIF